MKRGIDYEKEACYRCDCVHLFGAADGDFGKKTEQALRQFQEANGLVVTGVLDKATYELLYTESAAELSSSSTTTETSALYVVHSEYGYGYSDSSGNVIIDCIWDEAFQFSESLARVKMADLFGYIDSRGNLTINREWGDATDFVGGIASVFSTDTNAWGAINQSGEIIIPCQYSHISPCSEGIVIACESKEGSSKNSYENAYTAFDTNGKKLFSWECMPGYLDSYNHTFSEGLLEVSFIEYPQNYQHKRSSGRYSGQCAYMNTKGNIAFEVESGLYPGNFSSAMAPTMRGRDYSYGYIGLEGETILDFKWNYAGEYVDGLALVENNNELYGFIDTSGNEVIPCSFARAKLFHEDLAAVMNKQEKWGFIDKKGNLVIDYQFDDVDDLNNGLALCTVDNTKYYIDPNGATVLTFEVLASIEKSTE